MAKPQLENGYTQISNEILEAFAKIRISGECWQCLNVIIRKTYGFKKKEDWISLSQFVDFTGLKKESVCRALKKLIDMRIINKDVNNGKVKYSLQKDYALWIPLAKKVTYKPSKINKNDNDINNNVTPNTLTKKPIDINNIDNTRVTILLNKGVTKKLHTKALILKKDLQEKVVQNKGLSFKIQNIKNEFDEFVKIRHDYVIEQAEIVFDKPFYIEFGFDKFMDYWIRKEVDKMRGWIIKKPDKSQNLQNYDLFIADWFKREKPYPAYVSSADERLYYSMKGSSDVG